MTGKREKEIYKKLKKADPKLFDSPFIGEGEIIVAHAFSVEEGLSYENEVGKKGLTVRVGGVGENLDLYPIFANFHEWVNNTHFYNDVE